MNMKLQIPTWSVVTVLAVALVGVVFLFVKGGSGDASKEELVKLGQNQRNFSAGGPPSARAPDSGAPGGGSTQPPLNGPGAPPGGSTPPRGWRRDHAPLVSIRAGERGSPAFSANQQPVDSHSLRIYRGGPRRPHRRDQLRRQGRREGGRHPGPSKARSTRRRRKTPSTASPPAATTALQVGSNVPQGVTLRGSWESVPAHNGMRDKGLPKPTDGGTTFLVEGARVPSRTPFSPSTRTRPSRAS